MPFAVLSALAMPFGLEHWPLKIMGEGVHLMLAIARYFADLSPAERSNQPPCISPGNIGADVVVPSANPLAALIGLMLLPALVLLFADPPDPEILVSEDGRLVAFVGENDVLSVNRQRPNSFTTQTWQRATKSGAILRPKLVSDLEGQPPCAIRPKPTPVSLSVSPDCVSWTMARVGRLLGLNRYRRIKKRHQSPVPGK